MYATILSKIQFKELFFNFVILKQNENMILAHSMTTLLYLGSLDRLYTA